MPRYQVHVPTLYQTITRTPHIAIEVVPVPRVCWRGRDEFTQVWSTPIDFVPEFTGVFGRIFGPYQTLQSARFGNVFMEIIPPVYFFRAYPDKRLLAIHGVLYSMKPLYTVSIQSRYPNRREIGHQCCCHRL